MSDGNDWPGGNAHFSAVPPTPSAPPSVWVPQGPPRPQPGGYGEHEQQRKGTFAKTARPRFPEAVVALALVGLAWWMITSTTVSNYDGSFSQLFEDVVAVVAPLNQSSYLADAYDGGTRIAMGVAIAAMVAVIVWMVALGNNLRSATGPGVVLTLLALPNWFALPLLVGHPSDPSIGELKFRYAALLLMTVVIGLARVIVTAQTWRAGLLPNEVVSLVISVPASIAIFLYALSTTVTVFQMDEFGGGIEDSPFQPTEGWMRAAEIGSLAFFLGTLLLLVVVTVRQQQVMSAERRAAGV